MSDITKRQSMLFIDSLRLQFRSPKDSLEFLRDVKSVTSYLTSKTKSVNSLKTYFSRIVAVLRDKPEFKAETEAYRKLMTDYRDQYDKSRETQELTEAEKEKLLTRKQILKVRSELKKKATDLTSFQDYLIICLYTFLPPQRLDYADMTFTDKPGKNVCLEKKMVFREYKTASTFGERTLSIPKPLRDVISIWRELYNTTDTLLVKLDGSPMTPAALGQRVSAIFKAETGKACSVNILRHVYITDLRKGELSAVKKQKLADSMGHSVSTNEQYRRL